MGKYTPVKQHKDLEITSYPKDVHCSSTGHYTFQVWFKNGTQRQRKGWYENGSIVYWTPCFGKRWWEIALDESARAKIDAEIAARIDGFTVYEYDGDGAPRYIDHHYHDPERFRALYGPKEGGG